MEKHSRALPAQPGAAEHCATPDPLARDVADDGSWRQRVDKIIARCATRHRVTTAEILGRSRVQRIVDARWEAIGLVAEAYPKFSSTRLGEIFHRDHTSILWALGRVTKSGARTQ